MGRITVFAACLLYFAVSVYCQTDSLVIIPEKTKLLKLEGDRLQIDCVHKFSGGNDIIVEFLKDGQLLSVDENEKYSIKVTKKIDESTHVSTTTLLMNTTDLGDRGIYSCQTPDQSRTTSISVIIFKVKNNNADLAVITKGQKVDPVTLQCELVGVDSLIERNFTWQHDGKELEDGDKYDIFNNGTLVINTPVRVDMGEYQCSIIFFPSSDVERHTVTPKPCALRAGPAVDNHDNNKNMVQGDNLELKCEVSGYPKPTVSWMKDGAPLNETTRIHVMEYKGTNGKLTIYSLEDEDEAVYSCLGVNDVHPFNATAEMRVRVKDKLAALWPFLGIVAEVVVLCIIILVYERRRSKKLAEEEDAVDSNVDNTVDHKDVRHRRT